MEGLCEVPAERGLLSFEGTT